MTSTQPRMIDVESLDLFVTRVYSAELQEYLTAVTEVAHDPVYHNNNDDIMSASFADDERIRDFCQVILQTSWDVLSSQGYAMPGYHTQFESMWLQRHAQGSWMPQHVHANHNQLVGFYFLQTPANSCTLLLHDPRVAKAQIKLDETNAAVITDASDYVSIKPEPGQLILTPAWLAHTVTPNHSTETCEFVHVNVQAVPAPASPIPQPIIV